MSAEENVLEKSQAFEMETDESVLLSMDEITLAGSAAENQGVDNSIEKVETNSKTGSAKSTKAGEHQASQTVQIPIPEKIAGMLESFGTQHPSGEDPRYGDEFVLIKTEIDKLAFNDYNAVLTLCEEILKNQAKDMRVAGYFLLANTYINGLKGLTDGLMLYRLLLENFADSIYPKKENAQIISLQWLNNSKLLTYAKQHQNRMTYDLLVAIGHEVEQLNKTIISLTNDETLCLSSIYNWVKEVSKKVKPPAPKPALVTEDKESSASKGVEAENRDVTSSNIESIQDVTATQGTKATINLDIDGAASLSDGELSSLMRKIVTQLNAKKDFMRGVAHARATRWGAMSMPPSENTKTRLSPPRQAGINEIRTLLAQEDFEGALRKSEGIFFEMAGHMLLDLQLYAYKAAKGMGKNDLANLIAYETAALIRRLPGLEKLRFEDDTPFANAEALGWLNGLIGNNDSATSFMAGSENDVALIDAINNACEMANKKDLNTALAELDGYRPRTEKQRFQLRLALSQLCLDHGRPELAYPMLEDLMEQAKSTSLAVWDCGLAISVARQIQNALRSLISSASEQNRAQIEKRLEEVTAQMCRWDLALAAQIL